MRAPSSLFTGYFVVAFSYIVDGNQYDGKFYSSHEWGEGTELPILCNPQNPQESSACDDDESQPGAALDWVLAFLEPGL